MAVVPLSGRERQHEALTAVLDNEIGAWKQIWSLRPLPGDRRCRTRARVKWRRRCEVLCRCRHRTRAARGAAAEGEECGYDEAHAWFLRSDVSIRSESML